MHADRNLYITVDKTVKLHCRKRRLLISIRLLNNKIINLSTLIAFVEEKLNVTEIITFVLGEFENIVSSGDKVGYKHFLHFPLCFQMS